QLGAMLGDAAGLVFLPDHEACDVLQEQQRDAALTGQLDEVRALLRGLSEQDAVVGQNRDGIALYMREAADQRAAVQRLEFVEHRTVDEAGDYLADVERLLGIGGDDAIQLLAIEQRRNRCATV